MNPLKDLIKILKKDWKLLAGLNALYFCVIVIGAAIALISPGLHQAMIQSFDASIIVGQAGANTTANLTDALIGAGYIFASSFFVETLAMISIPSIVLPIWAPIIGSARFFIWGVAYVLPLDGVVTPGMLIPRYVAMLLEGEAYVVAVFACVRQLKVALAFTELGFRMMLKDYKKAVFDNAKLLIIVVILLAAAALYQALLVPVLNGYL